MDIITETLRKIIEKDQIFEVRLLFDSKKTPVIRGYYNYEHITKVRLDIEPYIDKAKGIYFTPNSIASECLNRSVNRLSKGKSTKDSDIIERKWLLIDIDPVRLSGISSTSEELEGAIDLANKISEWMAGEGWGAPIIATSGNGAHLMYKIKLENYRESTLLVNGCLDALSLRFGTSTQSIDTKVGNAARIWKLYGTWARKGDDSTERPHRMANVIDFGDMQENSEELVAELANLSPPQEPQFKRKTMETRNGQEWLKAWMDKYIGVQPRQWSNGLIWTFKCPFGDHDRDKGYVSSSPTGWSFKCHSSHCEGYGWEDLRRHYEPDFDYKKTQAIEEQRIMANDLVEGIQWGDICIRNRHKLKTSLLPAWLCNMVENVTETHMCKIDIPYFSAIGALSTVCNGKYYMEMKNGFKQPLNLYMLLGAPPSTMKSTIMSLFKRPVSDWQNNERVIFSNAMKEAKKQTKYLKEQIKIATKCGMDTAEYYRQLDEFENITCDQLLVEDITPEALCKLLAEGKERCSFFCSEGGPIDNLNRKYSADVANIDVYLKSFDRESAYVARINRDSNFLTRPSISMVVLTQPETVNAFMANERAISKGLVSRFLTSIINDDVRKDYAKMTHVDEAIYNEYYNNIRLLLEAQEEHVLAVDDRCHEAWIDFIQSVADRKTMSVHRSDSGWAGKIGGQAVRLAGLHHISKYLTRAHETPVGFESMVFAIDMCEYFSWNSKVSGLYEKVLEYAISKDIVSVTRKKICEDLFLKARATTKLMKGMEDDNLLKIYKSGGIETYIFNPKIKEII